MMRGASLSARTLAALVQRAKDDRLALFDRFFVPGDGIRNDHLFDELDSQRVAIEALQEVGARAVKLLELSATSLSMLNQAHDPTVVHLIKALAEAVEELA